MSFSFFCSNGTLDTVYPPDVYQVEPIDNEYPPDHYDLPVEDIQPTMESPVKFICQMAQRTILSKSALDSCLSPVSCFQGFLKF